jgi:pyridoxamine 5'-phosphate oxidase
MTKIEENPVKLFDSWLKEATNSGINEPEALSLATSTKDGKPSNRMVLLKGHDDKGFVFFTNLESKKGEDIDENPFVSMCFFWPTINKQVRIEGKVEKVSNNEADDYFDSRALNSKIGAIVSKQSRRIEENDFDLFKSTAMKSFKLLATNEVKRPDYWSGYRLVANRIEFWQRGEFRIHKRTSYERENGDKDWNINFLYP